MTLIEIAVGLVILAILLASAAPSFSIWIQNSKIRTTAEAIQNGLQMARAEAVRRNTGVQFILTSVAGGGVGSDWTVSCVNPVTDLDGDGVADCPGAGMTPAVIQTRATAEGSTGVTVITGQPTIIFSGLGRVTPAVASVNIDISNTTGGTCVLVGGNMRCLRMQVSGAGQIRLCDPVLAATDPQGCLP